MAQAPTQQQNVVDFFKKSVLIDVYKSGIPESSKAQALFQDLFRQDIDSVNMNAEKAVLAQNPQINLTQALNQGTEEILNKLSLQQSYENGSIKYKSQKPSATTAPSTTLLSSPLEFANKLSNFRTHPAPKEPVVSIAPSKTLFSSSAAFASKIESLRQKPVKVEPSTPKLG